MATLTAKDVSHVEKFNGTNFPFWKFHISLVLKQNGLMDIVTGTEACPVPDIDQGVTKNAAAITSWTQRDVAASGLIFATLDSRSQRTLINCNTSKEMWVRLKSQFEQVTQENKYLINRRFYDYVYQPDHDIMSHITAVEALANQLKDLGEPVTELNLITKIICTLPPSFDVVTAAWENLDDDKKTMQLLISRLLKHEGMKKTRGGDNPEDAAFFASRFKPSHGGQHPAQHKNPRPKCGNCGRRNHTEDKCWEKERQEKAKQNTTEEKAHMAKTDHWPDHYAFTSISFLSSLPDRDPTKWYADSGASQHMSDQKWMFHNYKEIIPGSRPVKGIGVDSKPLQIHGQGDIAIKCLIGRKWF